MENIASLKKLSRKSIDSYYVNPMKPLSIKNVTWDIQASSEYLGIIFAYESVSSAAILEYISDGISDGTMDRDKLPNIIVLFKEQKIIVRYHQCEDGKYAIHPLGRYDGYLVEKCGENVLSEFLILLFVSLRSIELRALDIERLSKEVHQSIFTNNQDDGSRSMQEIESSWFFNDINRATLFRSIFSTVEINYDPKEAKSVTAKEVDEEIEKSIRSGTDLATEIQQLLIDIKTNDANDLALWVEEHDGEAPPANVKDKRIKRFKNAFATVFKNLNFYKIINEGSNKRVLFKKDDHEVEISALSSGEKQIVFRGAFLLQNQQSSKGCCILIDEPEISLHPIWQGKIFDYYRNLFIDDTGVQTSQIFTATHSQYVLKSALDNSANTLILLLKNGSGTLEISHIQAPLVLPSLTSAEINYVAFDLVSNDYHIELYGYLQNKIAHANGGVECSVKECDTYITKQADYDATIHQKASAHTNRKTSYDTLPTYIRNAIDHPGPTRRFTQEELRTSIELLIKLCR